MSERPNPKDVARMVRSLAHELMNQDGVPGELRNQDVPGTYPRSDKPIMKVKELYQSKAMLLILTAAGLPAREKNRSYSLEAWREITRATGIQQYMRANGFEAWHVLNNVDTLNEWKKLNLS